MTTEWEQVLKSNHSDFFLALKNQYKVCEDIGYVVDENGHYETAKCNEMVCVNEGNWLKFEMHRKKSKCDYFRIGKINDLRRLLRHYGLFIRCECFNEPEVIKYYILHFICYHILFNKKIGFTYEKSVKLIESVVKYVCSKKIEDIDKSSFIDNRNVCSPDYIINEYGGYTKINTREKKSVVRKIHKEITDKKISELYDHTKTIKENASITGIGVRRLEEWHSKYTSNIESKEQRVIRMYDWNKSLNDNVKNIGLSKHTILKYRPKDWIDSCIANSSIDYSDISSKNKKDDDEIDIEDWVNSLDL